MGIFGKKKEKGGTLLPSSRATTGGRPITSSSSSLPSSSSINDDNPLIPGSKSARITKNKNNNSNGYEPPSSSTVDSPPTSMTVRASSAVSDLEGGRYNVDDNDSDNDNESHLLTIEPTICRRIESPYPMFGNNDNNNSNEDDNFASCFDVDNGTRGTNFVCFEVEYDKEQFHSNNNNRKNVLSAVSKRVTSFSHRVKSFRHDIRSQSRFDHQNQNQMKSAIGGGDDGGGGGRTRKNGSTAKIGQILVHTKEDDIEIMTLSSGASTQSNSLEYYEDDDNDDDDDSRFFKLTSWFGRNSKSKRDRGAAPRSSNSNYRRDHHHDIIITDHHRQQHDGYDDIDRMDCNEHARSQYKIWKRAAIEGPNYIRVASFALACLILLSVIVLIAVCSFPWTSSSIVSCFHLVVGSMLILLLESRSGICLPFTGGGCCLFQNNLDTNKTNDKGRDSNNALPIDAYREYAEDQDVFGAKSRDDVLQRFNVFRFLYGRGALYTFTGSMTIAMIPISATISNIVISSNSDNADADADANVAYIVNAINIMVPLVLIYLPGIMLMILGIFAFFAGVHAAFRWSLLDTSIHCNDEHLREKFISAARATHQDDNICSSNISISDVETIRLDQHEFSILVMTLGLDLDEISMIPEVFMKEIRTKNSDCITFNEFHSWWRGKKRTKSQRNSTKLTISASASDHHCKNIKPSKQYQRRLEAAA